MNVINGLTTGFGQFFHEVVGGPVVAGDDVLNAARGGDDDGTEVVIDGVLFGPEGFAELLGDGGDVGDVAGEEVPMSEVGFEPGGVGFEGFGGVKFGIEGDGEEM